MTRLSFAKDLPTAVKTAGSVVVVAKRGFFTAKKVPRLMNARPQRLLTDLAKDAKPGDAGQFLSTLTGAQPAKVGAAVLPDDVSRYNSAANPDGVTRLVQSANLGAEKKVALVLVLDDEAHLAAAVNAVGRAFPLFSRRTDPTGSARIQIAAVTRSGAAVKIPTHVRRLLEASREAAKLVDTPPTDMNPEALAAAAYDMVASLSGVQVQQYVGEELVEHGLMGIHSVGRAAMNAPRMLVATYTPKEPSGRHIALVGKGITFDTGGLHVKPRGSMEGMKCDMGGAAAVLGAFTVLAKVGSEHTVTLILCLAENAVGPNSYKPDDVLELHSGKTVEINNTDAEGRLCLADGVSWAARELRCDTVFDAATLTGAQMVATGQNHAAVVSNDADFEALVVKAGFDSGDLVHPLPFAPEFYRQEFKSQVADMKNSVKNRANAQSSCAAQFVYNHLADTKVKWCHVDLAGPSFKNERGTGYGVALLVEAVQRLSAS